MGKVNFNIKDAIQVKASDPNEYAVNCPFCVKKGLSSDTGMNLQFNTGKNVYHCWRCNSKGKLEGDFEFLGGDVRYSLEEMSKKATKLFHVKPPITHDLESLSWECTATGTPMAHKYLIDRGITDEEIKRWNIRVGRQYWDDNRINYEGEPEPGYVYKWRGRIIWPHFDYLGRCDYLVGRSHTGKEPKYLNSYGLKSNIIYNLNNVVGGVCIANEGIIDSMAAERATGVTAISTLGCSFTKNQLEKIKTKCNTIYLSYDGDVDGIELDKTIQQLMLAGFKVWLVTIPKGTDPDSLGSKYKEYYDKAERIKIL